uniref:Uncharacterized protein n=1 Tax=Anguilla anguilla TaxID=7936 RepID=A0A0E9QKS7_ANGAN
MHHSAHYVRALPSADAGPIREILTRGVTPVISQTN